MSETPIGLPEDPADFDLMEWITSGTVARREVPVYNRPDLLAEYQAITARMEAAGWTLTDDGWTSEPTEPGATQKDGPLSDGLGGEVAADLARWPHLEDELLAARAVWSVRALGKDDTEWIEAQDPAPTPPIPVPPAAPDAVRVKWEQRVARFNKAQAEHLRRSQLLAVVRGVESITTTKGTVYGVSLDALTRLDHTPHGTQIIDLLYRAIDQATGADVEIPRPTSPGRSTATRA